MPTTSNFGWTTPADTDLVKDGAAAIRTLGNGIDTSLVDLKGGTTGQVLSKNSNTDLDFTWVAQDDSNAIQNALLTTTGDTIYASAASTPARLGIGTSGQVLTVSGGVPAWTTISSGGMTSLASGSLSGSLLTISGISGSYNNLVMVIRNFRAGNAVAMRHSINNDNGSNRYREVTYLQAQTGNQNFDTTEFQVSASQNTSTSQNLTVVTYFDYANTSTWKMVNINSIANGDVTSTSTSIKNIFGYYNQTGAITRLDYYVNGTTYAAGTYTLYGVK